MLTEGISSRCCELIHGHINLLLMASSPVLEPSLALERYRNKQGTESLKIRIRRSSLIKNCFLPHGEIAILFYRLLLHND
jgi:hypothetical protein